MEARHASAQAALKSIEGEFKLAQATRTDYAALQSAAQAKLERHRELLKKRLISQVLFDEVESQAAEASIRYLAQERVIEDLPNRLAQARAAVSLAEAALEQAKADLGDTVVRAPFDGPVLAASAAPGEMNSPGRTLVEISSRDSLELRLEVPDRYVSRLENYLRAGIAITAMTEDGGDFALKRLGRQVRAGQSGIDAFFASESGSDTAPAIGKVLQARITFPAEADLVALPTQSIYENDRIYRVVDKRLHATRVERVGEANIHGEYRILVRADELSGGATVLVTQLPQAVNGMLVAPIETPASEITPTASTAIANVADTARFL
jgi:multidrug efflux pump subunit AcrA (membrane-fusion protein)